MQANSPGLQMEQLSIGHSTRSTHNRAVSVSREESERTQYGVSQRATDMKRDVSHSITHTSNLKVSSGAPQAPATGESRSMLNHAPHMFVVILSVLALAPLKFAQNDLNS